jgi:hypothetical protein
MLSRSHPKIHEPRLTGVSPIPRTSDSARKLRNTSNPMGAENSVTACDLQVLVVGGRWAGLVAVAGLTCRSVGSAVWWEGAISAIGQDVLDPVGEPADAIPSIHIART